MHNGDTTCLNDIQLFRYLEGELGEIEAAEVLRHLNTCRSCFSVYASVVYNEFHPFTSAERDAAEKSALADRAAFVAGTLQKAGYGEAEAAPGIESKRRWLPGWLADWRFVVPAMAIVILAAVVWMHLPSPGPGETLFAAYSYDEHTPYPFRESGFRGGGLAAADTLAVTVDRGMRQAMGEYLTRNYAGAITQFDVIAEHAELLKARAGRPEHMILLKNYYLYRGLSHLALATSKRHEPDEQSRDRQLAAALRALVAADALLQDIESPDDAPHAKFFLGLVLALQGKRERALAQLQQINPNAGAAYAAARRLTTQIRTK